MRYFSLVLLLISINIVKNKWHCLKRICLSLLINILVLWIFMSIMNTHDLLIMNIYANISKIMSLIHNMIFIIYDIYEPYGNPSHYILFNNENNVKSYFDSIIFSIVQFCFSFFFSIYVSFRAEAFCVVLLLWFVLKIYSFYSFVL